MIRFAWFQARTQTAVALGGLVVVAIVVALTGPHLVHLYDAIIATCAAHGDCSTAADSVLPNERNLWIWMGMVILVAPGLIGLFWGAPLIARELEAGTYRLAWTQSVTRSRWLAVKLAVVGLTAMTAAGLLSLLVTWWASPIDRVVANRFAVPYFDERGVVAIGYAAFAVALGVTVGLLIRRTVPAMATTLVAFTAARLATILWIRPHFIAPLRRVAAIDPRGVALRDTTSGSVSLLPPSPHLPNAWIYSTHFADAAGQPLTHRFVARACPRLGALAGGPPPGSGIRKPPPNIKHVLDDCIGKVAVKFHVVSTYQPAKNYWTFQWIELAMFLGAAILLSWFCFWWIRHRLA